MEKHNFKNLLYTTNRFIKQNRRISRMNGENFNIFSILGVDTDENKTHSRFIYELLNPNGSHYLKNTFLHLFIKTIFPEVELNQTMKFNVYKEYSFKEGRIDLMIESKDLLITIENKINAGDQPKQMFRYHTYNNSCNFISERKLCYLTLHGKEPSENSSCGIKRNIDFICISYKNHIIEWLSLCLKECAEYPVIRESIKQYIILLKKLTGQLTIQEMNQELISLISQSPENLEAARHIRDNYELAVDKLKRKEVNKLISKLISVGFEEEDIDRKANGRSDAIFVRLKAYNLASTIWDLGINIELNNNYYFFCMVERGNTRKSNINNTEMFVEIVNKLITLFSKDYSDLSVNGWSVGNSSHFTVGIDKDTYYMNDKANSDAYTNIAEKIFEIKNKLYGSKD